MATTSQRLAALEAWKSAHVNGHVLSGHTHAHTHSDLASATHTHDEPTPTPEPVPPPPPAPVPSGFEVQPGTGTIAAAYAQGHRRFLLRTGRYRDNFGSTQRDTTVSIDALPGQSPVIEPNGDDNFVYVGTGSWSIGAVLFRGFRAAGSGIFGCNAGRLDFAGTRVEGVGPADQLSHIAYYFGTGGGTLRGVRFTNAPGSALQLYTGSPKVEVYDSDLQGLTVGIYAYDGTLRLENARVIGSTRDIEKTARCALTQVNVSGASGPVRTVTV